MEPIDKLPSTMRLAEDKKAATLALSGEYTADGLEKLIADLAVLRANMLPEVTRKADPSGEKPSAYSIQDDPDITLQLLPNLGFRFGLRSEGFGWMLFDVPQSRGMVIRDYLIANTPARQEKSVMSQDIGGGKAPH